MNTNSRDIIIGGAAAALVISFFLPWISVVNLSAWDLVFGLPGEFIGSSFRYITVLIPIAGLMILYAEALNKGRYGVSKWLLFFTPLFTLIALTVAIGIKIMESRRSFDADLGDVLNVFGVGFWLTLIVAIALPLMYRQEEAPADEANFLESNNPATSSAPVEGNANDAPVGTTVVETP